MAMLGTVLLVEDEPSVGELVSSYLTRDGYRVIWVRSGEDALVELDRHQLRIVLLDIGLPGMDGYEVARRLRQMPSMEKAVLVAQTGWGQEEDRRRSGHAGFDHHFTKPIDPDALQKVLATLKTLKE
jgi:CheY-like chemotaxis protein